MPGVPIVTSAAVKPVLREHTRFSTATVRAVLLPVMAAYFEQLQVSLTAEGFAGHLMILKSNGGMMSVDQASERVEELVESGPAGGIGYAVRIAEMIASNRTRRWQSTDKRKWEAPPHPIHRGHEDTGQEMFDVDVRDDGIYVGVARQAEAPKTASDVMVKTMTNWGVKYVFGMVGHSNLGLAEARVLDLTPFKAAPRTRQMDEAFL